MEIADLILTAKDERNIKSRKSDISVYRIILFLTTAFTLLLRYLFVKENPEAFDPLSIRLVLSSGLILILVLSFIWKYRDKIAYLNYLVIFSYSIYILFLIRRNYFATNYLLEFILLIVIICLAFQNRLHLKIYLACIFIAFFISAFLYLDSYLDIFVKTSLIGIFCVAIVTFFNSRFEIEKRLEIRENLLNTIFNESPDAMLIADPSSSIILNCNERAISIFKIQDRRDLIGNNLNFLLKYPNSTGAWNNLKKKVDKNRFLVQELEFKTVFGQTFWGSEAITEIQVGTKAYWLVRISDITERVKDKKTIEESRKILNQIIDLVPHPIFLKDNEGRFVIVNKTVADRYEVVPEEMVGKKDSDFIDPILSVELLKDDREVIENAREKFIPEESLTFLDRNYTYQTIKIPFYFEDATKPGVLSISIDITDLKEAEKAIRESESKYKMLMEQASDGIYLTDKSGNILSVNAKACEMFGYTDQEFQKLNVRSLVDLKSVKEELIFALFNNEPVITELVCKRKDNSEFTVELSATRLDGGLLQGIIRDITARKKLEKILQDNEKKFRALIENSSDIIMILNEDFKISYVSVSVARILGHTYISLVGKTIFDLFDHEGIDKISKFLSETIACPGQNQTAEELKILTRNGSSKIVEIVAVNLLSDPVIQGIVLNCHDITKRKNTENELINTNFELDSFVYKASHDLKAPLRSVMGLIKLAKLESKDSTQHMYLDMMSKSVNSLDTFIKDLTTFSRNTRLDIEANIIDFSIVLEESLNNLKYMEHAEKIRINKSVDINVNFYSDLTRLSTIVNNLISNAIKYHRFENNIPYINISIKTDYEKAEIVVEDNGSGIDPLHINKIFDMFYRASENSYGSGLGLYIVKNAVKKLGGSIDVSSELDEGSSFKVVIPNLVNDIN
ncbi:MAG: PAS domain S-box protein [Sporocytophaga sp.]|uniref:PAS domain-containing protein n=1 Tax=Sporocytophaga sp. TaxID=2231183 RepID=UPI001B18F9E7|nr:PAS domain-containing sensor histidine kinase [Sporocytophaga sp.]MBO9699373.1 PAS domain S-box protein [Sporocytophaga sp.]